MIDREYVAGEIINHWVIIMNEGILIRLGIPGHPIMN